MLPPSLDYFAAWFGVVWAGAVDVPVNVDFKGEFLRHVLAGSEAKVLVVDERWLERLEGLELPGLRAVVVAGTELPAGRPAITLADALAHAPLPRVPRDEYDLAYLMYTSGTTGPSKGAMHSNRSALWNVRSWIDILQLTSEDVAYSMFPLFHVTARSAVVTSAIWAGAPIVLRDGFSASGFWDDVRESGATYFAYMGAVIHLLWAQPERPDDADNAVRRGVRSRRAAGDRRGVRAPLRPRADRGVRLDRARPGDGAHRRRESAAGRWGSCARTSSSRIDDERDGPCRRGRSARSSRGPPSPHSLFQGYWQEPEATLHAFRNLWFHTGDQGRIDEDGYLTFTDRIKDSIRRRGENISSFEVERSVQSLRPGARVRGLCRPLGADRGGGDDRGRAAARRGGRSRRSCSHTASAAIPRFAVPRYVRIVDALPKTPSQRIQKFKLRSEGITADTVDREQLGILVPRS